MRVAKIPVETAKFFNMGVAAFSSLLGTFSQTLAVLLVLFIVHQLFIWVDQDPEVAFERGALIFEVVEITGTPSASAGTPSSTLSTRAFCPSGTRCPTTWSSRSSS